MDTGPETTPASPNPWLAVIVTTLVFFLVVIDVSAVNVAFPSIRDDFDVAESSLGWIISGYNIAVASLLLVAGRYADSLGRKRLFIPGVAIFAIGSMLSAVAPSAGFLIASRVFQGIGGAIISPTAIAVVLPAFPPNKRSTVIGITGATGALGAVVGPALGAFLTDAAIGWIEDVEWLQDGDHVLLGTSHNHLPIAVLPALHGPGIGANPGSEHRVPGSPGLVPDSRRLR